ncbi:HEAT repeat domain-containing protein [Methanobrevibacter sp.]|uniref:HEAT repeat domain-containing protein n=1 Tax=Methanobrevibacter sp. TaxID=66852 RepID=UPI003890B347
MENLDNVKNETDEEILADLALNDENWIIRKEAIKNPNLCDGDVLEEILLNEFEDYNCFFAYRKLKFHRPDSKLLINPFDVEKVKNESELIDIIEKSIYKAPKIIAGKSVDMCYVYPYLVCPDTRWKVRWYAAGNPNLCDCDVLSNIALFDYDLRVRCQALKNPNFDDEDVINYLALNDCKYTVRGVAATFVRDESILKDIASHENESYVRQGVVSNPNMADESLLIDFALNDRDYHVRRQAALKISDDEVLKEIFLNDYHGDVRQAACSRLNDMEFLNYIKNGRFKNKFQNAARKRLSELEKSQ